jgi:hypothetical protein
MHGQQVVGSLRRDQDVGNHAQMELSVLVLEKEWILY